MSHDFKNFPELTNSQMELYYFESPHMQIFDDFDAKVIKVVDGDTIRVNWVERDFDFPIRFLDINAPEMNEGGQEAKSWLEDQVKDQEVRILINKLNRVDKFGRLLGHVFFNGVNLNEESIRLGHATPFERRGEGLIPDFNKELGRIEHGLTTNA